MPTFQDFIEYWKLAASILAIPLIIIVILLVYFIHNIDKYRIFLASIQRILGKISKNASKKSIESELSGRILGTAKELNTELESLLPHDIHISWEVSSSRQSFLDEGRVVLCMDQTKTRNQNIIHAIYDYINMGLFPEFFELFLDQNSVEAQKLVLTRKILKLVYKKGLVYYNDNMYYPRAKDTDVGEYVKTFEKLDGNGMFSHVFLRELVKCANSLIESDYEETEGHSLKSAVNGLTEFLLNISLQKPTDSNTVLPPLGYTNGPFSVCIILLAKRDVFETHGYQPYIDRFNKQLAQNYRSIYLCGRGDKKIDIAVTLQKKLLELYPLLETSNAFIYQSSVGERDTQAVTIALDTSLVIKDITQKSKTS